MTSKRKENLKIYIPKYIFLLLHRNLKEKNIKSLKTNLKEMLSYGSSANGINSIVIEWQYISIFKQKIDDLKLFDEVDNLLKILINSGQMSLGKNE